MNLKPFFGLIITLKEDIELLYENNNTLAGFEKRRFNVKDKLTFSNYQDILFLQDLNQYHIYPITNYMLKKIKYDIDYVSTLKRFKKITIHHEYIVLDGEYELPLTKELLFALKKVK